MPELAPEVPYELGTGERPGSLRIAFSCFDTQNEITIYGNPRARQLLLEAYRRCRRLHRLWTPTDAASDLSRINGARERVEVAPETADLLARALAFWREEPAFDCTVGALTRLWRRARGVPDDAAVARARAHVGAGKLALEGDVVVKGDPRLEVDFGSCAKGYAADLLAQLFRQAGVVSADIDLGGNLLFLGAHPAGRPWHLVLDLPAGLVEDPPAFEASDCSVVTASGFLRPLQFDGRCLEHHFDASTGRPTSSDIVSATAVCASSFEADALSTVALLAGSAGLDALSRRHPTAGLLVVTSTGEVTWRGPLEPHR